MIGITADEMDDLLQTHLRTKGVVVSGVNEGRPAQEMGLQVGDVITKLDGKIVADTKRLRELVQSSEGIPFGSKRSVLAIPSRLNSNPFSMNKKMGKNLTVLESRPSVASYWLTNRKGRTQCWARC